ncbi:MAG: YceD family protein [Steroidobacteraceae bacterium]
MSGGRLHDVDVYQLAAQGAVLEERFQLSKFARLGPLLAVIEDSESRTARTRFRFCRQEGRSLVSIEVEANLPLTCQRCLQPVNWPIAGSTQLAFAEPGNVAPVAGDQHEVFETHGGLVALTDVVEEELLLALPLVAMHAPDACEAIVPQDERSEDPAASKRAQTPFAGLKDLLGRK